MFKVKLSFDTDRLEQDILEQLYAKVDEIFESEDLNCVDRALVPKSMKIKGEEDYGRFGRHFCTKANTQSLLRI